MSLPESQAFPVLLRSYVWDSFHAAFGYPPDHFQDGFPWMVDLENRFKAALGQDGVPSVRLVTEMILLGGNQRGVLSGFSLGLRAAGNYEELVTDVVDNLDEPELAFKYALKLPRLGLTYGSKLLRFCRPSTYGALDSRIRKKLGKRLSRIYDGNHQSMWKGYREFLNLIHTFQRDLQESSISRPAYGLRAESSRWTATEVEMALYSWTLNDPRGLREGDVA
jgi:hypothetical protein